MIKKCPRMPRLARFAAALIPFFSAATLSGCSFDATCFEVGCPKNEQIIFHQIGSPPLPQDVGAAHNDVVEVRPEQDVYAILGTVAAAFRLKDVHESANPIFPYNQWWGGFSSGGLITIYLATSSNPRVPRSIYVEGNDRHDVVKEIRKALKEYPQPSVQ